MTWKLNMLKNSSQFKKSNHIFQNVFWLDISIKNIVNTSWNDLKIEYIVENHITEI